MARTLPTLIIALLLVAACTHVSESDSPVDPTGFHHGLKADDTHEGSWDGIESYADSAEPTARSADTTDPLADPVPVWPQLEEEPSTPCSAAITDGWYYQYLDNLCNEQVQPSTQDRDRPCPVADDSPNVQLPDGSWVSYQPSSEQPIWDTLSLQGLVPADMEIALILIKRVNGVPHYRYLSNGRHDVTFQPWSTTKVLAAANAASYMRTQSGYQVGLDATTAEGHKVGDLITSLVAYDNKPFTSNALGAWFHDIGGHQQAKDLIGDLWLNRPPEESFGGNYGSAPPKQLGFDFTAPDGTELKVIPDNTPGFANHLSAATLAESLKRLVLHREEPDQRLPGVQWADVKTLMFGAEDSVLGPWGGMTADTAIYLQAGHDMDYIEQRSQGQWLTLSKLGMGTKGQFVHNGYACWPVLDQNAEPVPGQGREFVIATHLTEGAGSWADRDRELARIIRRLEIRIVDGRL